MTGASFDYLLATAKVESEPQSQSDGADVVGDRAVPVHRADLARDLEAGRAGASATATMPMRSRARPPGRYVVDGSGAAQRDHAAAQGSDRQRADGAARSRSRMRPQLAKRIGRKPTEGELYVAHFFGPEARAKAIKLAGSDPTANAAAIFPEPAAANRSIFYDRQGNARSIAGVCAELMRRYQVARAAPAPPSVRLAGGSIPRPPGAIPGAGRCRLQSRRRRGRRRRRRLPTPPRCAHRRPRRCPRRCRPWRRSRRKTRVIGDAAAVVRVRARVGPGFHSLFHDDGRRGAVAPVVTELGAVAARARTSAAAGGAFRGRPARPCRRGARSVSRPAAEHARAVRQQDLSAILPRPGPLTIRQSSQRFMVNALLSLAALGCAIIARQGRRSSSSWRRSHHDRSSIPALGAYRAGRRAGRRHHARWPAPFSIPIFRPTIAPPPRAR